MNPFTVQLILGAFDWVKEYFNSRGVLPTEQELTDHLVADEDKYIKIGDDWKAAHPKDGGF